MRLLWRKRMKRLNREYPCTLKYLSVETFKRKETVSVDEVRKMVVKEKGKVRKKPSALRKELYAFLEKKVKEGWQALEGEK